MRIFTTSIRAAFSKSAFSLASLASTWLGHTYFRLTTMEVETYESGAMPLAED